MQQQRLLRGRNACSRSLPRQSVRPMALFGSDRPSLDPLANATGPYQAGKPFTIHSPQEFQEQLKAQQDKLVVLMCKSSHCKPCKAFAKKYILIAAHCTDTAFLEVSGDETQDTRKMMVEMGVKATPTFRFYRNSEFLGQVTGTKLPNILPAINERLKPTETNTEGIKFPEEPPAPDA